MRGIYLLLGASIAFTYSERSTTSREHKLPRTGLETVFKESAFAAKAALIVTTTASNREIRVSVTMRDVLVESREILNLPPKGAARMGDWTADFVLVPTLAEKDRKAIADSFEKYQVKSRSDLPHPSDVYLANMIAGGYPWCIEYSKVQVLDAGRQKEIHRFIEELAARATCLGTRHGNDLREILGERIGFSD